jgi:hypothetical protein
MEVGGGGLRKRRWSEGSQQSEGGRGQRNVGQSDRVERIGVGGAETAVEGARGVGIN